MYLISKATKFLIKFVGLVIVITIILGILLQYTAMKEIYSAIEEVKQEAEYYEEEDYDDRRKRDNFIYDDYRNEADW